MTSKSSSLLKQKEKQESEEPSPTLLQLPNKNVLLSDLASLLKKKDQILSAIFIDLDGFKQVNDRLGHQAGDQYLEAVVACVGRAITNKGKLFRYGGDEFVVLLLNFDALEAQAVAERIRKRIDETNPGGEVRVTSSVRVACLGDLQIKSGEELINAADQSMYLSKRAGKNRVTVWQGSAGSKQARLVSLFEVEVVEGKYWTRIPPSSPPSISLQVNLRVHNRRSASTTLYCDSLKLSAAEYSEDLPLPSLQMFGDSSSILDQRTLQIGANSTVDIVLFSQKHCAYGLLPPPFICGKLAHLFALMKETFGGLQEVDRELECANVAYQ